jgi:uncharacterized delta-60 repeat protein
MKHVQYLALLGTVGLLAACGRTEQTLTIAQPQVALTPVPMCLPINRSPGALDTCFSGDGKQTTGWASTTYEKASAIAVQSDGKIVVGGTMGDVGDAFALARYNTDGSLDTGFSPRYRDGKIKTLFGSNVYLNDLAIQSDGKIVAVGWTAGSANFDLALARYNVDGGLDTTFDTDGKLTANLSGNLDDFGNAVAIQTDGKILVAGQVGNFNSANADFSLVRYNADGTLDATFDLDGQVTTDLGSGNETATAIKVQTDGKIVVGGVSNTQFALARYNTDGSLDTTFDADGKVVIAFGWGYTVGLALQTDGKIVVAGKVLNASGDEDFAVARLNADGSLDTTFDTDGMAQTDFASSLDAAYSVNVQSDGKIVLSGTSNQSGTTDFALVRYNTDGSLDTTFDTDGKVVTNVLTDSFGSSNDIAYDSAIQTNGRIVSVGCAYSATLPIGGCDFAVTRHMP